MNLKDQCATIKIKTLSPLHIGSGKQLSSVGEFFTTQERIYFLDNDRLIQAIANKGKQEKYIQNILEASIGFDFFKVLKDWDIDAHQYTKKVLTLNQLGLLSSHNNILQLCIKTNNKAYIPGSSLKGLFRTAMIIYFFKENPYYFKQLEKDIREVLLNGQGKKGLTRLWLQTEKKFFPDFVFHAVRFTDSNTISDEKLIVEQMSRFPFFEFEGEGVDWLLECIERDIVLSSELKLYPSFEEERIQFYHYKNRLNKNDFNIKNWDYLYDSDFSKIFEILNNYSLILIDFEIDLLKKTTKNKLISKQLIAKLESHKKAIVASKSHVAIARLGKGKTLSFQTILPILSKDIKEQIIDLYKEEGHIDFPRTRVLSVRDQSMTGWIELDFKLQESELKKEKTTSKVLVLDKKFIDHTIESPKTGIILNAISTGLKRVEIMINGKVDTYQLINPFKQSFPENTPLKVIVHQVSNAGKIIQVKLHS